MKILTVNKTQLKGGAARIAHDLYKSFIELGHDSYYLVDIAEKEEEYCYEILPLTYKKSSLTRILWELQRKVYNIRGGGKIQKYIRFLGLAATNIPGYIDRLKGWENFHFPATWKYLDRLPSNIDIVNFHNLHDNYFDLTYLPDISLKLPTVITLHDEWLLTGHCAYGVDCLRWKSGCGNCPDLDIYPKVFKDSTNFNWNRKKEIYSKSRFFLVTHSQWLLNHARESILAPSIIDYKVIPTGVDQNIFHPANKFEARRKLGLPHEKIVILFAGNQAKTNPFKDYPTIEKAILSPTIMDHKEKLLFINIGDINQKTELEKSVILNIEYTNDLSLLASYYQASDVFIHAAKADNYPNTIINALSCGIPVIASDVGGISEQVKNSQNGFLFSKGNSEQLIFLLSQLILNKEYFYELRNSMAYQSNYLYSKERMVKDYIDFYQRSLQTWNTVLNDSPRV